MADESFVGTANPDVPVIYINDVYVSIGSSEISLIFREDLNVRGEDVAKERVRVVMTHDVFTRMVDFLEKRAKLFRRAYMNRTPNLYAGDAEELRKAFEELYPSSNEDASNQSPPET